MITLLLDTHGDSILLVIYRQEKLTKSNFSGRKKDHSTFCVPSIVKLLELEKIDINDISDIVVVNGPGSFTGIRIGVTIAKTLALLLNIPIRTITSFELYYNQEPNKIIAIKEKNGYYLAEFNQQSAESYVYLNNQEYLEYQKNHKVIEGTKININDLAKIAHQKKTINPHEVNPLYIKIIEVEK